MDGDKRTTLGNLLASIGGEHDDVSIGVDMTPLGSKLPDDARRGHGATIPRRGFVLKYHPGEVVPNVSFLACPPGCHHSLPEECRPEANVDADDDDDDDNDDIHSKRHRQREPFVVRPLENDTFALVGKSVEVRPNRRTAKGKLLGLGIGGLCQKCEAIDLRKLLDGDDCELSASSESCRLCALVQCAALEQGDFTPNHEVSPRLVGLKSKSGSLRYVQIRLPSIEDGLGENVPDGDCVVRCVNLELVSLSESFASKEYRVSGRHIGPADDMTRAKAWLDDCLSKHDTCHAQTAAAEAPPLLPSRVIDVGGSDNPDDALLFESHGRRGLYVALSHRWGEANISRTTLSVVQEHRAHISVSSLSQTFQDAICVTRKLGFRYLWIDSLCIIQDSPEDWEFEASRMADIYNNCILTLSASVASSGDSGLFYPRGGNLDLIEMPAGGGENGSYYITNRVVSSFDDDVERGTLAQRAWCLQERVLSRRILHFGREQLHWECLSGCWSESCADRRVELGGTTNSIETELREILSSTEWPTLTETLQDLKMGDESRPKQVYARGPYGKWYLLLEAFSRRLLTNEEDRLPALAGLAKIFQKFSEDRYVAGLWLDDIPAGLLWSGSSFHAPPSTESRLRRPATRRAPSWSWTSFDGGINYPLGKLGKIDISRDWECLFVAGTPGPFGQIKDGFIELSGRLRELRTMIGFTPGFRAEMLSKFFDPEQMPRALYDEPGRYDPSEIMCLLIAFRGCGSKICKHYAGCEFRFAYGLLLHKSGMAGSFKRVGIAQTYQSDWVGVTRSRIVIG